MGFLLGLFQSSNFKQDVIYSFENIKDILINAHTNNILAHLIILLICFFLSHLMPLLIVPIFYLFYNGLSIGFTSYLLVLSYKVDGLLFGLLYNLIFKGLFIILLSFLLLKFLTRSKLVLRFIIRKDYSLKIKLYNNMLCCFIIILIILGLDVILYFASPYILQSLTNMI